jgi:hypothetical protein
LTTLLVTLSHTTVLFTTLQLVSFLLMPQVLLVLIGFLQQKVVLMVQKDQQDLLVIRVQLDQLALDLEFII